MYAPKMYNVMQQKKNIRRRSVMLDIQTKLGDIKFSPGIINGIIVDSLADFGDDVYMMNYKGRYMDAVPGIAPKLNLYNDESGGIELEETENGIKIKVYIVVRFGLSIGTLTSDIIDRISENFEKTMGEKPENVTIAVSGVFSKIIGRRYIEVCR